MKKLLIFLIVTASIFSIVACKEENEPACKAGTGGNVTLVISPAHHANPIPGATVYIEFNTQTNAGAVSNYDLTVEGDASEDHIHVDGLRCGEYFIYAVGFDSSISQTVFGGIPFVIQQGQSGEIDVHVPVIE